MCHGVGMRGKVYPLVQTFVNVDDSPRHFFILEWELALFIIRLIPKGRQIKGRMNRIVFSVQRFLWPSQH